MKRFDSSMPACLFASPERSAFWYPGASRDTVVISPNQAKNLLRRSALHPHCLQLLLMMNPVTREAIARLRLKSAPGGRLLLHPEDAGTSFAAALGVCLERMGCLHKLGIAPAPFDGGVPVTPQREASR